MNSFYSEIEKLLNNFDINKGDTVMLVSDVTSLLLSYKKQGKSFNINLFLDVLLEKIGNQGTLLIPTYNYDFCKGITFDYLNTPPVTGSIAKAALKREDFKRTTNPIHSFAVSGKDKDLLCELKHLSSFGDDSPFYYLHKKNAKYFSISLNFTDLGFTPAHYVEEIVGVSYRYFKKFSGNYIDQTGNQTKVEYKFYVKDLSKINLTGIKEETDKILTNIKAYKKYEINNELYGIIELGKALDFFIKDMQNNSEKDRLIYPIKKNTKVTRIKINKTNARE
jgi:aminoglycoside 3-N-acetyltransferase